MQFVYKIELNKNLKYKFSCLLLSIFSSSSTRSLNTHEPFVYTPPAPFIPPRYALVPSHFNSIAKPQLPTCSYQEQPLFRCIALMISLCFLFQTTPDPSFSYSQSYQRLLLL